MSYETYYSISKSGFSLLQHFRFKGTGYLADTSVRVSSDVQISSARRSDKSF